MNYRHAFHAGNFADVIKHIALVAILLHLRRKVKPFCVIDTHAGGGVYDLGSSEAARTGEAAEGISRIAAIGDDPQLPESLKTYLDGVRREGEGRYPGSARIAACLLRPQDRLVAIEKHPEAARTLRRSLAAFPNVRTVAADGYARLAALLPPRERRGVILIDPPYEADDEFARVGDLLALAHSRFATGIYVAWYPIKSPAAIDALYGELGANGVAPVLRLEIETGRAPDADKERLSAAGLLVINPPFGFDEEMRSVAAVLAPLLGRRTREPAAITLVSTPA
ncbi:MAG TPA: 23S rRNA (adenine(2030)-N(6))-methyltransferase RlmJ [Rhizomicrobium sp.]|jgi:23S rRNA (adenine2030-N6)-methyltransferase|nr:23S rRNA (adenine(2030)-N(6))-methyltransferase RlmJ [Rhizomicrobium sp.]